MIGIENQGQNSTQVVQSEYWGVAADARHGSPAIVASKPAEMVQQYLFDSASFGPQAPFGVQDRHFPVENSPMHHDLDGEVRRMLLQPAVKLPSNGYGLDYAL